MSFNWDLYDLVLYKYILYKKVFGWMLDSFPPPSNAGHCKQWHSEWECVSATSMARIFLEVTLAGLRVNVFIILTLLANCLPQGLCQFILYIWEYLFPDSFANIMCSKTFGFFYPSDWRKLVPTGFKSFNSIYYDWGWRIFSILLLIRSRFFAFIVFPKHFFFHLGKL